MATLRDDLVSALDEIDSDWMMGEARQPYPSEMADGLLGHSVVERIRAEARAEVLSEVRSTIGAYSESGVWAFDSAVATIEKAKRA